MLVSRGEGVAVSGGAVKRVSPRKNTPAKFICLKNGENTRKIFLKTKRPHMRFDLGYKNFWSVLAEKNQQQEEAKTSENWKSLVWCRGQGLNLHDLAIASS